MTNYESDKIRSFALLRRRDAASFELKLRWLLGTEDSAKPAETNRSETADALPHPDDEFGVQVEALDRSGSTKGYLHADGSVKPGPHEFLVSPRKELMLDPPRRPGKIGNCLDDQFLHLAADRGVPPYEYKVSCGKHPPDMPSMEGFGICHLLLGVDNNWRAERVEQRLATVLSQRWSEIVERHPPLRSLMESPPSAESYASFVRPMAEYLVKRGPNTTHLEGYLRDKYDELMRHVQSQIDGVHIEPPPDDALAFHDNSLGARAAYAGVMWPIVLEELDWLRQHSDDPRQVSQQLRIRSLQGGNLIDFTAVDADQVSASEAVGCGITLPKIKSATVEEWISEKYTLRLRVWHIPKPHSFHDWGEHRVPMSRGEIHSAWQYGASMIVEKPAGAWVNYDLTQLNEDETSDTRSLLVRSDKEDCRPDPALRGPEIGYKTGDGTVQILIEPPPMKTNPMPGGGRPDKYTTVYGFNVYGVMNDGSAAADAIYGDLAGVSVGKLKPFLITRRYSFERDLRGAYFPGGNQEPGLKNALSDPPWQPVLVRPAELRDEQYGCGELSHELNKWVPNSERIAPLTIVTLDLRAGRQSGTGTIPNPCNEQMPSPLPLPGTLPPHWDPEWLVDLDWAPRTAEPVLFFVTSVDAFEQESAPLLVEANDYVIEQRRPEYWPVRRSPLRPPASDVPSALELIPPQVGSDTKLSVTWKTPFRAPAGGFGLSGVKKVRPEFEDFRELDGHVVIFKKLLRSRVDEKRSSPNPPSEMLTNATPFHLPQWQREQNRLSSRGWVRYQEASVEAPVDPALQEWSVDFELTPLDQGFEFIALVGFSVKEAARMYWAPNTDRRMLQRVKDGVAERVRYVCGETPQASDVVATNEVKWVDTGAPRNPSWLAPELCIPEARPLACCPYRSALHVRPVPGIQRDHVLRRLLQIKLPADKEYWLDTKVSMWRGQRHMLTSALERIDSLAAESVDPLSDLRFKDLRRLLATEFSSEDGDSETERSLTHPVIGFRGAYVLGWTYTPKQVGEEEGAETVLFRIYQARAPYAADVAGSALASVKEAMLIKHHEHGSEYEFEDDRALWNDLANAAAPLLVRVRPTGQGDAAPQFGDLASLQGKDNVWRILIHHANQPDLCGPSIEAMPFPDDQVDIDLFAGQLVAERPAIIDAPEHRGSTRAILNDAACEIHELALPVGGGPSESFCWWIVGVSAQEIECDRDAWLSAILSVPASVEPEAPTELLVAPAPRGDDYKLKTQTWRPSEANENSMRLVLSWNDRSNQWTDETGIMIERRSQSSTDLIPTSSQLLANTVWQTLRSLETATEYGAHEQTQITPWLHGDPVEIDGPSADYTHIPSSEKDIRFVPALEGLKKVYPPAELPAKKVKTPAFIDYYRDSYATGDRRAAIDGSLVYKYRVRTYVKLADTSGEFLLSRPTMWTDWGHPETPSFCVDVSTVIAPTYEERLTPAVRFLISRTIAAHTRQDSSTGGIYYQVLIRRKANFTLPFETGAVPDERWIPISEIALLRNDETSLVIVDSDIRRTWPEATVELEYSVLVNQLFIETSEEDCHAAPLRGEPHREEKTNDYSVHACVDLGHTQEPPPFGFEIVRTVNVAINEL